MVKEEVLLQMVLHERRFMPRLGGRKLLERIHPQLPLELMIGRDSFFDFLTRHHLLVRRRRTRVYTTYSKHWLHKYSNLVKDFVPERPHQLWVSDITYIETAEGFMYLSLITDAYSRKIVGWALGDTLEAKHSITALKMALQQLPEHHPPLYHHSDRGIQYCSEAYVKLLNKHSINISMTDNGDPLENAVAERVNGILKDEWLNDIKIKTKEQLVYELSKIISIYNSMRPHSSVSMLTPEKVHLQALKVERKWKNYYKSKQGTCKPNKELTLG